MPKKRLLIALIVVLPLILSASAVGQDCDCETCKAIGPPWMGMSVCWPVTGDDFGQCDCRDYAVGGIFYCILSGGDCIVITP